MSTAYGGFFDVVVRQRSCRAFLDTPVDDALVERMLEAAIHAPSAENSQPWVFVVVRQPATRARIGALGQRIWEGGARAAARARLSPELLQDVDRGLTGGVAAAPVLVVVGADTARCHHGALASSTFPAVQNLLLAAGALGLGSALTTIATTAADELRAAVGLPETVVPVAVVPVGWPARRLGPPRRRPVREVAFRERYGEPW